MTLLARDGVWLLGVVIVVSPISVRNVEFMGLQSRYGRTIMNERG